jgi:1-aminocyclopropane-1-carboxylate synthase
VIWGLSKDFCASGLRVGILWTSNKALAYAVGKLAYFNGVSNYTQWMLEKVRDPSSSSENQWGTLNPSKE